MNNKPPSTPPPADYVSRVEKACAQLAADGKPITADAVAALASAAGFDTTLSRDLAGRPRVLTMRTKGLAKRC